MTYGTPYTAKALREWHDDLISTDERTEHYALEAWESHDYMPLKWALDELDAQAAELDALRERLDDMKAYADMQTRAKMSWWETARNRRVDYNAAMSDVSKLYAMVQGLAGLVSMGSGCFSDEWVKACAIMDNADELIGVVPAGDVSAPVSTTESVSMDMLHISATENARLREALAAMIECAEVSADFDMLEPSDEIAPGGYAVNPAYKVLENARALIEGLPLPFDSDAASEDAPADLEADGLTVMSEAEELRELLSYFVCHWPAKKEHSELDERMFSRAFALVVMSDDEAVSILDDSERAESAATVTPSD